MLEQMSWEEIWSAFQKTAQAIRCNVKIPPLSPYSSAGLHVESITKAPFTDVPLPAFQKQDRKWNVERRAWLRSSSPQLQRTSPCGALKRRLMVVTHAPRLGSSVMWVCLLRAQWKSLFHSSNFPHVSAFHPRHCRRRLAAQAPTVWLLQLVSGVIGYQFREHISSVCLQ